MFRLQRQQFVEAGSAPVLAPVRAPGLSQRDTLTRAGRFLRHHQAWILPLTWLAILAALRPILAFEDPRSDLLVNVGGVGLILIGQVLRAEALTTVWEARTATALVTGGTYSITRNPLYLGALLVNAGLLMVFHHPLAYLLGGLAAIAAYAAIVAAEEPVLHRRFGRDYWSWCREVPRWGLKLSALPGTFVGRSVAWRHALVEDHVFITSWLLILLWAGIYDHAVRINGRPDFGVMLAGVSVTAGLLLVSWILGALHRQDRLGK